MDKKSSLLAGRNELIQKFIWEMRKMATANVLHATTVAHQVGIGVNDMKCAELLVRNGQMTAGQLAESSGLTTGAITGVVDRLEKAGWARRQPDPHDRRRVIIQALPQDSRTVAGLYDSYMQAISALLADYNDQELARILEFLSRYTEITSQEALKVQSRVAADEK
jgi:DNA-binding MarR family transcriptional regulator